MSAKPRLRARGVLSPMVMRAESNAAASTTLKNPVDWLPAKGSPDSDTLPELDNLVARSRDLVRNSGLARGGVQTIVDNVVGTGLRLTPRPNYRAIGRDKAWADAWSTEVYAQWLGWADTTACDAADSSIFDAMTAQTFRSWLQNGEACGLPLWISQRGDGWSTKLQTIEADRLSNPQYRMDDEKIRGGIEYDRYGAPVAYHVRKTHPGDWLAGRIGASSLDWSRIPRRTSFGRLRFLHAFDRDRAGQGRGLPLVSSVMRVFKQLDRYTSATLDQAVLDAMAFGFIETPMDQESIEGLFQTEDSRDAYLQSRRDHAVGAMQSGTVTPLHPGDTFKPWIPTRPTSAFASFCENMLRFMAVGHDMPYELFAKDWSKTNYSSGRAAMLEAWRSFNRRRDALGTQWCDPIYWLWLEEAVNAGRIDAPGFYENRAAYQRCWWIGPGRGWVDPVKEAKASLDRMSGNLSTLERECAELQGMDWREVLEQRKTEDEFLKSLGLTPMDGAKPAAGPAANEPQPFDVEDEEVQRAIREAAEAAVGRIIASGALAR